MRQRKTKLSEGVTPPTPIENLRTGRFTHFGPRRAYDGSYVLELLAAKGVTQSDVESLRFIALALHDGAEGKGGFTHMRIGELANLSACFVESCNTTATADGPYEGHHMPGQPGVPVPDHKPTLTVIDGGRR